REAFRRAQLADKTLRVPHENCEIRRRDARQSRWAQARKTARPRGLDSECLCRPSTGEACRPRMPQTGPRGFNVITKSRLGSRSLLFTRVISGFFASVSHAPS